MTIRKLSYIFYLVTGALISLLTLFIVLRFFEQQELNHARNIRYTSFLVADELRQSSDDLTRMARAYVDTGNPKFERFYWKILAIRNGEEEQPLDYERSYWDLVVGDPDFQPRPGGVKFLYEPKWRDSDSPRQSTQNLRKPKVIQISWCNRNAGPSMQ